MTIETLKEELNILARLSGARAWEAEIERDFSPSGAGMPFPEEMKADAQAGKFKPF